LSETLTRLEAVEKNIEKLLEEMKKLREGQDCGSCGKRLESCEERLEA